MSNASPQMVCPKCGTVNQANARFCFSCGSPLANIPPAQPVQPSPMPMPPPQPWYPPPQQYYGYTAAYYEFQRREQIDRTATGLLLIAIGFFLSWVPFIAAIGYLLEIIGAILVIMGRRVFGPKQARNVFWSIIIFIVGIVAVVVTVFIVIFLVIAYPGSPINPSPFANSYLLVALVWAAFIGLVEVLFVYELELTTGRILLWCGYAGSLVTTTVNIYVIPNITTNFTTNIFGVLFLNGLVSLTPAIIKGVAYMLARERIVHGEIPTPQQLTR
jgi:hypothetical protein